MEEVLPLSKWLVLYRMDQGWFLLQGKAACWLDEGKAYEKINPDLITDLLSSNLISFSPYRDEPHAWGFYKLTKKGKEAYLENYV